MFSVAEKNGAVVLESATSKVTVWPKYGAILNNWDVSLHGQTWEVIDGYDSYEDFENNCETKGFRSCKLSPYVCRLNKSEYSFNGTKYHIGKFILDGNAIHGLLYNVPFEVKSQYSDDESASVVLLREYEATDNGYPFAYSIETTYRLTANNQLSLTTVVKNKSNGTMPLSDGWHPYFKLGKPVNELQFVMDTDTMVEFDAELVPSGNMLPYSHFQEPTTFNGTDLDNCFVLKNPSVGTNACQLINPQDNIALSITADQNYPFLQVYTPPHRLSIAIENLSSVPDAFNNQIGLQTLAAGDQQTFKATYKIGHFN